MDLKRAKSGGSVHPYKRFSKGIEATRQIKALRPTTQVIVLTVHDDQELVQAADEAGAYCYLVKDCPPSLIGEVIMQAWEFKQG